MTINPHTTIAIGPDGKPWTRADITRIRRSQAWRNLSTHTIATQPVCYLRLPGCTRRSTCADHVIPAIRAPWRMLDPTNIRGACRKCNDRKHHRHPSELVGIGPQRKPSRGRTQALARAGTPLTVHCIECGDLFDKHTANHRICSPRCAAARRAKQQRNQPARPAPERNCAQCGQPYRSATRKITCSSRCAITRSTAASNTQRQARRANPPTLSQARAQADYALRRARAIAAGTWQSPRTRNTAAIRHRPGLGASIVKPTPSRDTTRDRNLKALAALPNW